MTPKDKDLPPLLTDIDSVRQRLALPDQRPAPIGYAGTGYLGAPLMLDLRDARGRATSVFLHRLKLVEIPYGELLPPRRPSTWTEEWRLDWKSVSDGNLAEAVCWGDTLVHACTARTRVLVDQADTSAKLMVLLRDVLVADLPDLIDDVVRRVRVLARGECELAGLVEALPSVARILLYGDVRRTDSSVVEPLMNAMLEAICQGLPTVSHSLSDEPARQVVAWLDLVSEVVRLCDSRCGVEEWVNALRKLDEQPGLNGLLAGRLARILFDSGEISSSEVEGRLGAILPGGITLTEINRAAGWLESFLSGSGLVLLHDDRLGDVLDRWVSSLQPDTFTTLLPLLRRTFARFPRPERRQMGERVRTGPARGAVQEVRSDEFDPGRAERVLPLVAKLLGVEPVAVSG